MELILKTGIKQINMNAKKSTPKKAAATKKPLTKTQKPAYVLLLKFDTAELKQLEIVKKTTNEATATKAIMRCLYKADQYEKDYREQRDRAERAEAELKQNKGLIRNYLYYLKQLQEVNGKESEDKEDFSFNNQLDDNQCRTCGEELNKRGQCPEGCEQD